MNRLKLTRELAHWQRVVQEHPHTPMAYIRRGMAHFKLAEIAASIQDFDRAEQLNAQLTPYLWQRGLSFLCRSLRRRGQTV